MNNRLINTKVAAAGGCTDIVDNYDPFGGNGVALYQLNGDATDVSTNYDGAASNVTYGTGVFGQAGVFNGSSSYIDLPLTSLFGGKNTLSVSFWFNTTTTSRQRLFSDYAQTSRNCDITIDGGNLEIVTDYGATSDTHTTTSTYNDGNWHHLVVSISATQRIIYIDNTSVDTITLPSGSWDGSSQKVTVGAIYTSSYGQYFDGSIDQVRIFNTALDPLEVEALYTEELCICDGTVDTLDILGDGSCIATYQLDGNANDLSGNYSGTPTDVSYGVGEFDLAGVFNGSSSYITSSLSKTDIANTFSVSFWWNPNALSGYQSILGHYEEVGNIAYGWSIVQANNKIGFYWIISASPNTSNYFENNTILQEGQWYHIVATITPTSANLYVDESSASSSPNQGSDFIIEYSSNPTFYMGRQNGTTAYYANGKIDQVRFFDKAISSSEVTTLYNETPCS